MGENRELLTAEKIDEDDGESQSPVGYLTVEIDKDVRDKLQGWVKNHLQVIEDDMGEILDRFDEEVNQFEGFMPGGDYPYPGAFRVNVPITKKKVREIANRLKQAYLDSDPIWAIVSQLVPQEIVSEAEKALDGQMDNELEALDDLAQAIFNAVLHGVGALEPGWEYLEDVMRDMAVYKGFDGLTVEGLEGLFKFEQDYPNWQDDEASRDMHKRIAAGEDIDEEVSYRTATVNRPSITNIPVKDLRISPHLNNRIDMQRAPMYGYMKEYTRMELEDFAEEGTIEDEVLGEVFPKADEDKDELSAEDAARLYPVLRATIRYKLPKDEEAVRYKIWYEKDSGTVIRIRHFPWWLNEPDLVLFHTRQEEPGIFKRGIAWDLKETHIAANVTFSLFINGADMANAMKFKAKSGSIGEAHVLNRRWSPHIPLPWKSDPKEIDPMAFPTNHLGPLVQAHQMMRLQSDEDTQTTGLQTGRESPTDPDAPATKTIALLQQTEPNTKEYLRSLHSGFRLLGKWVLWLFYQGKRLKWIDEVPGFPDIPDEMLIEIAKRLSPRAVLFEFDRSSRLQADNMVLNWVTKLAPSAIPTVLRKAISHVNSDWARDVDSLPLEQPAPLPGPSGPGGGKTPGGSPGGGASRLSGLAPGNGRVPSPRAELLGSVR